MATAQMLQIPFPEFYYKGIIAEKENKNPINSDDFLVKNLHIQRKNITFALTLE